MSANIQGRAASRMIPGARETSNSYTRRTTTDDIFDQMYADITSLHLKPGAKVSEIEVAKQFSVSRQPVREAFIRLSNMGLLLVRPQRATVVRKISLKEIADSRFIRQAIEVEVARVACEKFNESHREAFEANMAQQKQAVEAKDFSAFKALDAEFHQMLCITAGCELAHVRISEGKAQVDRLCTLAISQGSEVTQVYTDHVKIYEGIQRGDVDEVVETMRLHLSRLDKTIAEASASDEDFFED